jgi:DNA-binding NtrC family response regulator
MLRMKVGNLVGISRRMQQVYRLVLQASAHGRPVLIRGEIGTGKRLAALSIHSLGSHKAEPFVAAGRSTFSPSWQEGELFGDESDSPAQLFWAKSGVLPSVGEGTLYLREISDLPPRLQQKLSVAIEKREYSPMGSTRRIPFNARVIAATRNDLETLVRTGGFDEELYFDLTAMEIRLPALRERKSDLSLLIDYFLEQYAREEPAMIVSDAALDLLLRYDWPGNVRELNNVVQKAIANAMGAVIQAADLPLDLPEERISGQASGDESIKENDSERYSLVSALEEANGNITMAASNLGLDVPLLRRRLKSYGLASAAN